METSDLTFVLDNEALCNICVNTMKVEEPTYGDLNQLVCASMSGVTTCLRFPGQLNADLRKLSVNMIPFPILHFLVTSYAPLTPHCEHSATNVSTLVHQLFNPSNIMASCDTSQGKYLSTAVVFRGIVSTKVRWYSINVSLLINIYIYIEYQEVEEEMSQMQMKLTNNFIDWLPSNVSTAICDVAPPGCCMCATFIGNTSAIGSSFARLAEKFSSMLSQKAFLHWYTEEGLQETEFNNALQKLKLLTCEYQKFAETVQPETGTQDVKSKTQ